MTKRMTMTTISRTSTTTGTETGAGPAAVSMENNEAAEINDVAPSSLSHLIGQRGVIDQVRVAPDAAMMDGKKFDHA